MKIRLKVTLKVGWATGFISKKTVQDEQNKSDESESWTDSENESERNQTHSCKKKIRPWPDAIWFVKPKRKHKTKDKWRL